MSADTREVLPMEFHRMHRTSRDLHSFPGPHGCGGAPGRATRCTGLGLCTEPLKIPHGAARRGRATGASWLVGCCLSSRMIAKKPLLWKANVLKDRCRSQMSIYV